MGMVKKHKKNALLISKLPPVLHAKPLVRAIGPVEFVCLVDVKRSVFYLFRQ